MKPVKKYWSDEVMTNDTMTILSQTIDVIDYYSEDNDPQWTAMTQRRPMTQTMTVLLANPIMTY